jgi:uncharacterized protein (TIGR03118 family)
MKNFRAAAGGLMAILCAVFLQSCGGGYHAPSGAMTTPTSISISVNPTTVIAGRSTTLMWSATSGTACTASGAWSGTEPDSGTMTVTPTTAGTETFTLTCNGGIYSSSSASATLTVTAASVATVKELVSDLAVGTAGTVSQDPNLVNPWGLSIAPAPAKNPAWVANNGKQTSTLYDGNGVLFPAAGPLVVNLVAGVVPFNPTGIVFNSSATDFIVNAGGKTGSSAFIFDGEGGMIAGWSPGVDLTHAVTMYTDTAGADYKGLAIAANNGALFLYATDFHNNKIDVFNTAFLKQASSATAFTFADPSIPAGYAPFGIQAVPGSGTAGATQIYVTYAKQLAPANTANAIGAGLGYVDIYDTNGKLIKQLIAAGALNAPWGLAVAPADFGTFSGALLVGNFGDGMINAFDAAAGTPLGALADTNNSTAHGAPGLWGIAFGNDSTTAPNQPHNTLFFTSGINGGADGVYGRIDLTTP